VLDGRAAALDAQRAAAAVRELTAAAGRGAAGVAKAVGADRADPLVLNLERFEVRAQAVEQDVAAAADGTAPVEAASPPADNVAFSGGGRGL